MKSTLKNNLLVLLVVALFGITANAQQNKISAEELSSSEWVVLTDSDGIKMSVLKSECKMGDVKTPFTYGFLKIENTTNVRKHINFNINLYYADGCAGCDNANEEYVSISIEPNSTISTDCSFNHGELALLIRNPLQSDYQDFKYLQLIDFKID